MIFLVVVVHAGIVYENVLLESWLVIDPVKNDSIGLIRMYLDLIIMFTLFFISGYFMPMSSKGKSFWPFFVAKFKRLMIPWFIAVFTLIPAYKWIFLYSRDLPQEVWYSYFHFFERTGGNPYFFADNPVQNWLWFLPVLFLFQIIYWLMLRAGVFSMSISLRTGVILTIVIGVVYGMVISQVELMGWHHSFFLHFQRERFLIYFMVFLLGTLCYRDQIFDSGKWSMKWYIISNVVLTIGLGLYTVVALNLFFNMIDPARDYYFLSPTLDRTAYYTFMMLSMFSFLHVLLYSFRRYFNKSGRTMTILNQNSYYVYIIHMIVLGFFAYFFIDLQIPVMMKFLILAILTFTVSNVIVYAIRTVYHVVKNKK